MKKILIVLSVLVSLCSCTYTYDIDVYLASELKEYYGYYPSLEVDIVGVNDEEKNWLDSYDIDKYFEADNPLRASLRPMTMRFSQNNAGAQRIYRQSHYWGNWKKKGAKELYIMANLPVKVKQGNDPRKLIFKIRSNIFKTHNKYIEIMLAGLVSLPNPPESSTKKSEE